jgi:hypothetical protein
LKLIPAAVWYRRGTSFSGLSGIQQVFWSSESLVAEAN